MPSHERAHTTRRALREALMSIEQKSPIFKLSFCDTYYFFFVLRCVCGVCVRDMTIFVVSECHSSPFFYIMKIALSVCALCVCRVCKRERFVFLCVR